MYLCNKYTKQKQLGAVKRALPSKVESVLQLNLTGKNKDWYQVVAKWIQFPHAIDKLKHASVIELSLGHFF